MMRHLARLGVWMLGILALQVTALAQPGGCAPATTNGTCPTSQGLVAGAPCVNGTTCGGGAQAVSSCLYAGSQCSWYRFFATQTDMYVYIDVTNTDGCHISSNVYRSTGNCTGVEISCLSGAPLSDAHFLTGLTIGALYYVQVCYSPGGPCGNGGSAEYCISVGETPEPCDTCADPCGAALGYASTPSVQQVVNDCQTDPFLPPLQPGTTQRFCNSFTATSTSVDFNVIITSNCGAGNVSAFSWDLYNSPSCGAPIQSGTLASLTFNGLTIGNSYVFCYSFTVPASCTHSQHCPFFVGATTPLPVEWLGLDARATGSGTVELDWATATEQDNAGFTVERSADAALFEAIGWVPGAGDSQSQLDYGFTDHTPLPGTSYYRVRQTDHDGGTSLSNVASVLFLDGGLRPSVHPNPVRNDAEVRFHMEREGRVHLTLLDGTGRAVRTIAHQAGSGLVTITLSLTGLSDGVYSLVIERPMGREVIRLVKQY